MNRMMTIVLLWIPWYDHTYAVHMLESAFDLCISIVDQPILSSTGFPSNKQLVLWGNGIHNLKWPDRLGGPIAKVATLRRTQASVPYAYDIWFYNGETWWNCMDIYVGGSILSVVGNRTVNDIFGAKQPWLPVDFPSIHAIVIFFWSVDPFHFQYQEPTGMIT